MKRAAVPAFCRYTGASLACTCPPWPCTTSVWPLSSHAKSATPSWTSACIMTRVSSEWSRLRTRHVPPLSAASTKARLDTLLEPGVGIVAGSLGMCVDSRTSMAGASTCSRRESGTALALSSAVAPKRDKSTTFFCAPAFFLSTRIMSRSRAVVSSRALDRATMRGSASDTGRSYSCRQRMRRPIATCGRPHTSRAISASRTMPIAIHSPCSISGVSTASIAWPIEWPKLTRLRSPVSFSSTVTIQALTPTLPRMTSRSSVCDVVRVSSVWPCAVP